MGSHEDPLPTLAVNLVSEAPASSPTLPSRPRTTATHSGSETPEKAVASSPLLRVSDLSPRYALSDRPSARNSYRNSTTSSLRLSKDLNELRWDGSSLREDDSIFNVGDDRTRKGLQTGSESDAEAPLPGVATDKITYSTLSKRADLILANAKKKLNLLEGNLGRARHSLVVAPQIISELDRSDSTASTQSAPFLSKDHDRTQGKGPRIHFAPPRSSLSSSSYRTGRLGPGHSRVFSDTSVPSQVGTHSLGNRSFEIDRNDESIFRQPSSAFQSEIPESGLDSVPEDRVSKGPQQLILDEARRASRSRSAGSSQELQSQANQLRHHISYLQQQSHEDIIKRQSSDDEFNTSNAETGREDAELGSLLEADNYTEIESLATQESTPEHYAGQDSRAEWHQVLEQYQDGSTYSRSHTDEDSGLEDVKLPDALADEMLDEYDEPATDQPHETRNDAFDYEHFILHSIMGNGIRRTSSSSSSSVSGSQSLDDEDTLANERSGWIDSSQLNERDAKGYDEEEITSISNSESDQDDVHEGLNSSWPVPPSAKDVNSTKSRATTPNSKRANSMSKVSQGSSQQTRRPESEIVLKLLATLPSETPSSGVLAAEDTALFYAVVESLREVCMRLQHGNLGPHDGVDLRQRLEIARRVLKGEL